jgi:hypothetical protein
MDLLSAVVDRAHEPAPPAEDSNQAATELAEDPDPDRLDRYQVQGQQSGAGRSCLLLNPAPAADCLWLVEFRVSPPWS